jgi:arsenate reductase
MKDCILHNPRCRKSRETLALLKARGAEIEIVEYLKNPPTPGALREICALLDVHPTALFRTGESQFRELGLSVDDDRTEEAWIEILVEYPRLIERPIVVLGGRAVVGRPPENVLALFD